MSKRKFLVGLIGANIMKSLSPAMHADAFAAAGIEGYYHLMDVDVLKGGSLPQLFEAVKIGGLCRHQRHLSVQAGSAGAARRSRPRGGADRRRQHRHHCAGRPHQRLQHRSPRFPPQLRGRAWPRQRGGCDRGAGRRRRRRTRGRLCADGPRRGDGGAARPRRQADGNADGRPHQTLRARRAAGSPTDLERDIAAADGVVNATPIGMLGFPGNPVPVAAFAWQRTGRPM